MSTFVPEKPAVVQPSNGDTLIVLPEQPIPQPTSGGSEQIRVNIQLQGVQVILVNSGSNIARLDLSKAAVSLLLQGNTLKIAGRLEDISITDEISPQPSDNQFKQILCREGDHFADFGYETFDPNDAENFTGVNSVVTLRTAALRLNFLEKPLHEVYIFLLKLARLKGLYDAATQAAAQSVSEITRMRFDVLVKSPIIVFPKDSSKSSDALVLRLGEISARNQYDGPKGTIEASLQGIGLTSQANLGDRISILKMIDDVLITATVVQTENVDHTAQPDVPDTKIIVNVSDIKLGLTQHQYCDLYLLSQAFTRVLASPPEAETSPAVQSAAPPSTNLPQKGALNSKTSEQNAPVAPVDLVPEIALSPRQSIYPTLDLELKITTIKLQLFDDKALSEENLRSSGIARFALQDNSVRFKMYSNGGGEAEVILKSFTVTNTMPGPSKFREIIPPAKHDRNQFMVLFTMTGGKESSSLAIVTIESPKLLFTLDPLFALGNFFSSAFVSAPSSTPDAATVTAMTTKSKAAPESPPVREDSTLAFRIDLNDVSVTLLESDTDINSQAVQLSIRQLMMSQQGSLALNIMQLGMSLGQMGKPDESVRFMDDIDITLSMESKHTMALQRTSIDLSAKPIVFRASQQDINLILAIVTRATQLAAQSASGASQVDAATSKPSISKTKSQAFATEKPQLIVSTEKLCASFDGFRLVLIGEGHEQPMMHLKTKPFQVNVQDWTGPMRVSTALAFDINYWNLTNSHWEPLLEPWTFVVEVNKDVATQAMRVQISSPHVLSANISMTFVELALAATSSWTSDNTRSLSRARGGTPPYRIKNETGSALEIWSNTEAGPGMSTLLQHDQVIDWRFDDWRSLREHVSSSGHNSIGIKFHGKEWDSIPSVTVDKEGQFPVILRPRIDGVLHRLLCDVVVEGNLKLVTLRSTYKIDNECLYPLEVILVDDHNKPAYALQKIDAKQSYSLPIEAVMRNRIKIRPDAGFGFGWSAESFKWEDLTKRPNHIVTCRSQDPANAPFRLSLWAERGGDKSRTYPKLNIKLYPPVELENLLPFDIRYRVHDKASGTSSTEFLRQGGIFPIHTVTLDHLVLLNIAIQDSGVWKPSNFMIINTNTSEFTRDKRLILPDVNGRQLELGLNYIPHGPGDSFKVQIYSPYIIINKTGLPFEIRSVAKMSMNAREVAGETRKDELAKTTPFMLSNTSGHEFVLKIGNSEWSETLDVEAPTAETDLVLPARNLEGHLGVSWTPGSGKYACSKVITLAPRFIVKNSTSAILRYREYGGAEQIDLQPGSTSPILWTRREPDKLLLIAYPGLNAIWSEPINMENIGSVHLRLQPNDQRTAPQLIKADIEVAGATLFVTLQRETKWPFRIENLSDHHFTMVQSNEAGVAKEKAPKYELVPRSAIDYAWDFPASSDKFLRLTINGFSRTVQITEIGSLLPFKFLLPERSSRTVALDIRADGSTQILSITNYNEERSVYKRARAPTGRQETLMSQEAFEAVQEDSTPSLTLFLILEGFGLSLINRSLVEVVHFSAKAFKLEYTMSDTSQSINLSIGDIQLDNQLPEATFQVVLQPSPLPSRRSAPPLPAVQTSIVLLNDKSHGVMFVKYASILLQSLTIMLDEDFLMEILDMTKIKGAWQGLDEDVLIREPNLIPEPDKSAPPGQEIYFEGLLLQPLRFIVSFVRAERTTQTT
ncbi:hypothetical protein FRC20_000760 [Serendipita sp. 405]|nr:hypothetical protein FRC20_000760 [Serendipita sp. 405]